MEYDHMAELGLMEEKQFITSCNTILSRNDYARNLCARFIRNGDRFFDIVSRYDDLNTYALNRDEEKNMGAMKMIVPFLKAYGITDHGAYSFACEDLDVVPGAKETMSYLNGLLPSFIITGSFEHHIMSLCDRIEFPMDNTNYTKVEFDQFELDRQEARTLREFAGRISSLRLPKTLYTLTEAKYLDIDDAKIVTELDDIFVDTFPKMDLYKALKEIQSVSTNEKAYALLEIRRRTEIEFNSTVYVGSGLNDNQALDLVRDSDGLALSYNGSEYAVRASNVAVLSNNSIVIAVLAAEFYNEGIQAVYDMIDNWDRKSLETNKCSDRNLMDTMLRTFPKKLPVVKRVTRSNMKEVIQESEDYRKKVMKCVTY